MSLSFDIFNVMACDMKLPSYTDKCPNPATSKIAVLMSTNVGLWNTFKRLCAFLVRRNVFEKLIRICVHVLVSWFTFPSRLITKLNRVTSIRLYELRYPPPDPE